MTYRSKRVAIASCMIAAMLLLAFPGIALGDATATATRTIAPQTIPPGETVQVTVEFTSLLGTTASFALEEVVPAGWTIARVSDDATMFMVNEWIWIGDQAVEAGETKTVIYNLTIPIGTDPDDYDIDGMVKTMITGEVYNPVGGHQTVTVEEEVVEPEISVSPASWNFGNVVEGTPSPARTFTVSNVGAANLVLGTITRTGTHAADFAILNDAASGQTVPPGASVTLQVVFTPSAIGTRTAQLNIPSNDPDRPIVTVSLSGNGVPETVPTVGGTAHPISRLPLLALWIALGAAIVAGAGLLMRRRRATR